MFLLKKKNHKIELGLASKTIRHNRQRGNRHFIKKSAFTDRLKELKTTFSATS